MTEIVSHLCRLSKAYDRILRQILLECLKQWESEKTMLLALTALYKCTKSTLNSEIINACIGVWQGAPNSGLLFTMHIDSIVRKLEECFGEVGFLAAQHVTLFMDDNEIMANSRETCKTELKVLLDCCSESGMFIDERNNQTYGHKQKINKTGWL